MCRAWPSADPVYTSGVDAPAGAGGDPEAEAILNDSIGLALLVVLEALSPAENRRHWERWQEGLTVRLTLPEHLPPLRLLLILDNLTGHYTETFVRWLFAWAAQHGRAKGDLTSLKCCSRRPSLRQHRLNHTCR